MGNGRPLSAAEDRQRPARPCIFRAKKCGSTPSGIRLRRRLPSAKRRLSPLGLKPRKKEKVPGEWASQLNGNSICSYPPEDLLIEDYGRFLKKKGKSILSEERVRVEPFTTSLLDGIDLRETIRNWHEGKIYVRQFQKIHGEVGSVVVIFDEDRDDRYPYITTWLGEHQNESDMAFYSTFPFDNLVGPGIGRGRVWRVPDEPAAAAHVRCLAAIRTTISPSRSRSGCCWPALDYSHPAVRGVCGRQAAAVDLPHHRGALRPHHHLHSDRPAFAGGAEEDPRGARAGRVRQAAGGERVYLVVFVACAPCSNSAGHEKRWPAPQR